MLDQSAQRDLEFPARHPEVQPAGVGVRQQGGAALGEQAELSDLVHGLVGRLVAGAPDRPSMRAAPSGIVIRSVLRTRS